MTSIHVDARMSAPQEENRTFERSLAELERVVRDLEDGQLGLEDALARYETGVSLLKRCYAQLQFAEQRILVLTGTDPDGHPLTQPFDHSATAETANAEGKRKRKKSDEPDILF
jgi:exodeoxyribonuclease VII small subunit